MLRTEAVMMRRINGQESESSPRRPARRLPRYTPGSWGEGQLAAGSSKKLPGGRCNHSGVLTSGHCSAVPLDFLGIIIINLSTVDRINQPLALARVSASFAHNNKVPYSSGKHTIDRGSLLDISCSARL